MRRHTGSWLGLATVAAVALSACDREASSPAAVDPSEPVEDVTFYGSTTRTFTQVERLGNPLVNEVFVAKRDHGAHNSFSPQRDPAHFSDDITGFVSGTGSVAGRDASVGNALAATLLPDMLTVFPNRAAGVTAANVADAATVGWLTHVLAPSNTGYGGRKLQNDDTVDKGLSAIFGSALAGVVPAAANNTSPGLSTDNVGANDKTALTTFPYFPAGTPNP